MQQDLALFSLVLAGDAERAADRLEADPMAPGRFVRLVDRHALRLLARPLLEGEVPAVERLRSALPPAWLEEVTAFSARQLARQNLLIGELAGVDAALRARGVEPIALKGPYAAVRFHGGLDRRAFSDLDLFVPPHQLDAAERALSDSGFVRRSTILLSRRLTTRFTHAFDFAGHGIVVDLHWWLFPHPSFRVDESRPWRIRQTWPIEGRSYRVLPEGDEVRFGLVSVFRDVERGAARLKHIADLLRMLATLDASIDWADLLAELRAERMLAVAVNVLELALSCGSESDATSGLAEAVAAHCHLISAAPREARLALLEGPHGALANKRWAGGIYESSRLASLAWWGVSLPFRLAVHHPGKLARLRRRYRRSAGRPAPCGVRAANGAR